MGNHAGDLWLVGDGGIYNHDRLRIQLGADRFRSRSDHEAALHLFDDEGVEAFERLWGEFAFVIAGDDGRFAATRDTLGVVPLYWARRGETVLFASELKAFDEDWRGECSPSHRATPGRRRRAWWRGGLPRSLLRC